MPNRKPVIAVVDDDPRVIESLEDLLESAGYAVRCFSSAETFLACDLLELDLLITDVGLPNVDGLQLRSVMMQRHPRLPVFLITGRHEIADQARAKGHYRLLSASRSMARRYFQPSMKRLEYKNRGRG